ncbi:hypothetical protein ABKX88_001306 [Aeromonas veronii]
MAEYNVEQFSSNLMDNGFGYYNIYILCRLRNSNGNSRIHEYRVAPDVRFEDVAELNKILSAGFNYAKDTNRKIEIIEFEERMYLWITLPLHNEMQQFQLSGEKLKKVINRRI